MTPLSGIRVLDLGIITAGAATSAILSDLGAQVIKVESQTYSDPFRKWNGSEGLSESPFFQATNRGKSGLRLNLKSKMGRDVFLRLVEKSDVVVENFSRGVLEKLGLGIDVLKERNPRIVLASISSQGLGGPLADYVSFGTTLEAMSGFSALGADGVPVSSGQDMNYPDQVVALFAAGAIMTQLLARTQDGPAMHIDISQRELTTFMVGETFLSHRPEADTVSDLERSFLAKDGKWIAISMMQSEWASMPLRLRREEDLGAWISTQEADAAIGELKKFGIECAMVQDGRSAFKFARDTDSVALARNNLGQWVKGLPLRWNGQPLLRGCGPAPAPSIGQDNEQLLLDILGMSREEILELESEDRPRHEG